MYDREVTEDMPEPLELLTLEQVADLLKMTPSALRSKAASAPAGTYPPSFRVGRRRLYRRADVDAWVEQRIAAERSDEP